MTDRIVVITGATGGLGPVAARAFAAASDRVAAVGRSRDALEAVVATLEGPPGRHSGIVGELGTGDAAAAVAAAVRERIGPASVLVHLVGRYAGGASVEQASESEWRDLFETNLWTTFHALRAFLPDIRAAAGGRIVTVSSPLAQQPSVNVGGYVSAKAALETLTMTVARELVGTDATANVILVRTINDQKPTHTRPDEMTAALLWLCSPAAGAVNGQRIPLVGRGL